MPVLYYLARLWLKSLRGNDVRKTIIIGAIAVIIVIIAGYFVPYLWAALAATAGGFIAFGSHRVTNDNRRTTEVIDRSRQDAVEVDRQIERVRDELASVEAGAVELGELAGESERLKERIGELNKRADEILNRYRQSSDDIGD
jgi:uncharacterized phage infection (PIP) family protein YhgE